MKDNRYRLCNDCQRPFKLGILSRQFDTIFCPFCDSINTATISREQYLREVYRQHKSFIQRNLKE